jgi:hypothetical protein
MARSHIFVGYSSIYKPHIPSILFLLTKISQLTTSPNHQPNKQHHVHQDPHLLFPPHGHPRPRRRRDPQRRRHLRLVQRVPVQQLHLNLQVEPRLRQHEGQLGVCLGQPRYVLRVSFAIASSSSIMLIVCEAATTVVATSHSRSTRRPARRAIGRRTSRATSATGLSDCSERWRLIGTWPVVA